MCLQSQYWFCFGIHSYFLINYFGVFRILCIFFNHLLGFYTLDDRIFFIILTLFFIFIDDHMYLFHV